MTDERKLDLRQLAEAATGGPWEPLTHGTASQRDAAGRAFLSIMAVRDGDIEFTDLSWVDLPDGRRVALIGNGPNGPANSKYIAAANPSVVLGLLSERDALRAALERLSDHHNGKPGHHPNDDCWPSTYALLYVESIRPAALSGEPTAPPSEAD